MIWFFRDPSNKCEWKYYDRYTAAGDDLESKFSTTILSLIGASAACTGAVVPVVPSTTTSQKVGKIINTTTIKTDEPTKQASRCPIVVDVRTKLEWDEGHASCAQRLEIQNDPSLVDKVSALANGDLNYPVYVYCQTGIRSGDAMKILKDKGWTSLSGPGGWKTDADDIEKLCDCEGANVADGTARHAMSEWTILTICMLTLNQIFA